MILKTMDIRTVLYSIAKQLKLNDEFKYAISDSKEVIFQLTEDSITKNEILVMKALADIRRNLDDGISVTIFINGSAKCNVIKMVDMYIIICLADILECIFFEMMGECEKIKVEYSRKRDSKIYDIKYSLNATYENLHIINVDGLGDTFSHVANQLNNQFQSTLIEGKDYKVIITSKFIKENLERQGEFVFRFEIVQ